MSRCFHKHFLFGQCRKKAKHKGSCLHVQMEQHIQLYVNDYSVDLGNKGREAVILMMQKAQELNLVNQINQDLFVYQN